MLFEITIDIPSRDIREVIVSQSSARARQQATEMVAAHITRLTAQAGDGTWAVQRACRPVQRARRALRETGFGRITEQYGTTTRGAITLRVLEEPELAELGRFIADGPLFGDTLRALLRGDKTAGWVLRSARIHEWDEHTIDLALAAIRALDVAACRASEQDRDELYGPQAMTDAISTVGIPAAAALCRSDRRARQTLGRLLGDDEQAIAAAVIFTNGDLAAAELPALPAQITPAPARTAGVTATALAA